MSLQMHRKNVWKATLKLFMGFKEKSHGVGGVGEIKNFYIKK